MGCNARLAGWLLLAVQPLLDKVSITPPVCRKKDHHHSATKSRDVQYMCEYLYCGPGRERVARMRGFHIALWGPLVEPRAGDVLGCNLTPS